MDPEVRVHVQKHSLRQLVRKGEKRDRRGETSSQVETSGAIPAVPWGALEDTLSFQNELILKAKQLIFLAAG